MEIPKLFYEKYRAAHLDAHIDGLVPQRKQQVRAAMASLNTAPRPTAAPVKAPVKTPKPGSRRWLAAALVLALFSLLALWFLPRNSADLKEQAAQSLQAVANTVPALGKPLQKETAPVSVYYDLHWPFGSLEAERLVARPSYLLGFASTRRIPRWVAFQIKRGSCRPGNKLDPLLPDCFRAKIAGYQKVSLLPPALACGADNGRDDLSYSSLHVPMTPALASAWNTLRKESSGFSYMLAGPDLNATLLSRDGVAIPLRYFVVLVNDTEKRAFWFYNEDGRREKTDPQTIERETGQHFFDEEI